jgi:stage II sporulation protein M
LNYSYKKNYISSVIRRDMPYYLISGAFLLIGVIVGSISVKVLDFSQKKELVVYMNKFFQLVTKEDVSNLSVFFQAIKNNFQTVFFIWILSITVIGVPVTLFIISFRGFIIGFTIAFFVEGFGVKGLLLTLITILPQNLILIPCLIVLSTISLKYSLGVLRKNIGYKNMNFPNYSIVNYTITLGVIFLVMSISAIYEAFLSTTLIKLVSNYFIIG